jgi:hypothetical protein
MDLRFPFPGLASGAIFGSPCWEKKGLHDCQFGMVDFRFMEQQQLCRPVLTIDC